jgi:pseudaminic acid synthase
MKTIKIGKKMIGNGCPVFIIAELSANHGHDFDLAVKHIKAAKACGADAVKLQTYTADTLTLNSNNKYFKVKGGTIWDGTTLHKLYRKAYTPWEWHAKLKKIANRLGLVFFSTAFDKTAIDFLEDIDVPMHKIASFELIDLPLVEYAAKTRKPIILSTGMATLGEIKEAVATAKRAGANDIILLKCVSRYPANPKEMNLKTIVHMEKLFGCPVGLSDHTLGTDVSIAAVAMGAKVIEKHFILSRKIKTPDSVFSIEPDEFNRLVTGIRTIEKAIGDVRYGPTQDEKKSLIFRRSLFVCKGIKKGEIFNEENIRSLRPAYGLKPKYLKLVLGKRSKRNIRSGSPLRVEFIKGISIKGRCK